MKLRPADPATLPCVVLLCLAGVTHAQVLVNGSFEAGTDPNTGPGKNIGMFAPDSSTISGWTLSSGTVDYIGSRWAAGDGVRSLDLSGISAGSILQLVDGFTPGLTYELSFLMAANPEGGAFTKSLRVDVGSASQIFSYTGLRSPNDMGWAQRTLLFTTAGPTATVVFTSLEDNASGPALDRVRLVQVPEPSSWGLLVAGVLVLRGRSGRRRRATMPIQPGRSPNAGPAL